MWGLAPPEERVPNWGTLASQDHQYLPTSTYMLVASISTNLHISKDSAVVGQTSLEGQTNLEDTIKAAQLTMVVKVLVW